MSAGRKRFTDSSDPMTGGYYRHLFDKSRNFLRMKIGNCKAKDSETSRPKLGRPVKYPEVRVLIDEFGVSHAHALAVVKGLRKSPKLEARIAELRKRGAKK